MNTTASTRIWWVGVILILLLAGMAEASTAQSPWQLYFAAGAVGATDSSDARTPDKRKQVNDLLRRARQAMGEDDLAMAESLIAQAESLGVKYNAFHLGDTPKKARRDLQRKQRTARPRKPSRLFSPLFASKKDDPDGDPFAGRFPETSAAPSSVSPSLLPVAERPNPLPIADRPNPAPIADRPNPVRARANGGLVYPEVGDHFFPATDPRAAGPQIPPVLAKALGRTTPADTASEEKTAAGRSAAGALLCQARKALAVGDVRRAARLLEYTQGQNATFPPQGDSPEKVEAALRKVKDLAGIDKSTEAYRRAYARNLLEQADALAKHGELDEAERLVHVAASQRVIFTPFEPKPQDVLGRIAALRKSGGAGETALGKGDIPAPAANAAPPPASRQQAAKLVQQAREALAAGQIDRAEKLARKAETLKVPPRAFGPREDRPGWVLLDVREVRQRHSGGVRPASHTEEPPSVDSPDSDADTAPAVYYPQSDSTRNLPAVSGRTASVQPATSPPIPLPPTKPSETLLLPQSGKADPNVVSAQTLFERGKAALKARDKDKAYQLFQKAAIRIDELDSQTAQRLQDHLQLLSGPARSAARTSPPPSIVDETAARQQVRARQMAADLAHCQAKARAVRLTDPQKAISLLQEARTKVASAGLAPAARGQLLRRVDRAIAETDQFIKENRPQLELTERNNRVREDIEREQKVAQKKSEELKQMYDDVNRLIDEHRYEEAQVVAKRAAELDPSAQQAQIWTKLLYRIRSNEALREKKEYSFMEAMNSVDETSEPFDDRRPYRMPDAKFWEEIVNPRAQRYAQRGRRRTEREIEIEQKLKTPVSLSFINAPLSRVVDYLAKVADVNIHLDPKGLDEEGVSTDDAITIEVQSEIMLKSALNLILEPLHLSYVIKDEVLKITSEQMRDGEVYAVTYDVGELVMPIPNFVPVPMGLQAAYRSAMANVGFGGLGMGGMGATSTPMAVVASREGKGRSGVVNPNVLAQMSNFGGGGIQTGPGQPVGFGPGGIGGGTQADFDQLIDLIENTVAPNTWIDVGGQGSISPFETNLSLVISQTQEVHEQIADLLEQLRRLQDLQVTIEVRFITLNDNFFERIGVDFDFDIHEFEWAKVGSGFGSVVVPANPAAGQEPVRNTLSSERDKPATVGITSAGAQNTFGPFSADLDVPFRQSSFGLAIPQFGGYDPGAGASLGFAILSDLEAYFFIEAAQGDRRSNVLQAPKVTLFNGQQAYVSDTSQSPFVISVIPVVGEFAAAQQPVIVVLSEGTFMTVQAVISDDRRFVRLTVVPFFSKLGEVNTFTFTGSETTTTDTTRDGVQDTPNDSTKRRDAATTTKTGTTVQLPTFSYVTVTTTVSVPDGGTVLLGGIKRLSEGRNEFGVPLLNKVPYVNRLFKNVGIGRDTQSLMMMVTPRIIIPEEEEEALGISVASGRMRRR